jgi:dTMP kinase
MQIDLKDQLLDRFIVFEGLDGSGQDTQAKLYAEYLKRQGYKVWLTSEPSKELASLGVTIRYILNNEKGFPAESLQLLFVADRALHLEKIRRYLADGYIVISIRYLYSTLAYGFADGLDINWLVSLNRTFPRPRVAVCLDLPSDVALGRVEMRARQKGTMMDRFENKEHLSQVRSAFHELAGLCPEIKIVDATGNPEEVTMRVREAVGEVMGLETKEQKPLDLFTGSH